MKKKFIGRFCFDGMLLCVYAVEGCEAKAIYGWRKHGYGEMHIGMDDTWPKVVQAAMHEVLETAFFCAKTQYNPGRILTRDAGDRYMYFMNHFQFGEAAQIAGDVWCYLFPMLDIFWKKWNKKKGGKR